MAPEKPKQNMVIFFIVICLVIGVCLIVYIGFLYSNPVRVGFSAQLTGTQAELGVQERNGVQLAMNEINAAGGIRGRPIELIIRDDLGTPEGAKAADRELINRSVVAIIGHATSGQTLAGLEVTGPAHVVMLSPTTSTAALNGKDDLFFRVIQSIVESTRDFAWHVYHDRNVTRIAVIYDTDNAAYVDSFRSSFEDEYHRQGGMIVSEVNFSSKSQPDFAPLLAQVRSGNPEGLLIIATDFDTALIAQRTRLIDWNIPLYTSAWAQTGTLITNGGPAVEGLELAQAFPVNSQAPAYLDFRKKFSSVYGTDPAFGAVYGYESAQVLAKALETTGGRSEGLPDALRGIENFTGLVNSFSIDKYGDVQRPYFLAAIHNGTYVDVISGNPEEP
jgi:branched-chain amino acid transport system substrate-binding protein